MTANGRRGAIDAALIAALASGVTQDIAAETAGVSPRTVRRRLEDPDFVDRLEEERSAIVERTCSRLVGLTERAVVTLAHLLKEGVAENVRLRAATVILDTARAWRDAGEVEERLRALETFQALPKEAKG